MRRPRRAGLGVLSHRRAPNLGKFRRRACLRLIPFSGTGDVLLAPTMISHPLAYVAPTTRQWMHTVMSLEIWHVMLLKRYPPMLRSRQGSARDLAPSFTVIFVCTSAPPSRSWSIRPSVLRQVRLTMTLHASTPVTLVLHPALDLRSAESGFQTQLCHPGSL